MSAGGVNYGPLDRFKRAAQQAAAATDGNLGWLQGWNEVAASRGESAFLIEAPDFYLAHVQEGLGTKNLVADAVHVPGGKTYYDAIAQDTVAMIINDVITAGALPISLAMHLAVAESDWFNDEPLWQSLLDGWRKASTLAGCVWGGGETPQLKGVIVPGTCELSGSSIGIVQPKSRLLREEKIEHGDDIYLFNSNGIHANGLTNVRHLTNCLVDGYRTVLGDGRTFGEHLLDPTRIYVDVLRDCFEAGIDVHYAVNVTGHGWRKLMRPVRSLTYVIDRIPVPPSVLQFIRQQARMSDEEAYATYNMGAGFALYVARVDRPKMAALLRRRSGHLAWLTDGFRAGEVLEDGQKRVVIRPVRVTYEEDSLEIR